MNKFLIIIPTSASKKHWVDNVKRCKNTWIKNIDNKKFDVLWVYDTDRETYRDKDCLYINGNLKLKLKMQQTIKYLLDNNFAYKYIIKCDDDTYVNPKWINEKIDFFSEDLIGFLHHAKSYFYIKNHDVDFLWPHGSFCALSFNAYSNILQENNDLENIISDRNEDVWFGYALQSPKYSKLKLNKKIYVGSDYKYVKNLNKIIDFPVIHTKNTSLYSFYENKISPQIFDIYHAIVQLSGGSVGDLLHVKNNEECFNVSFDYMFYESGKFDNFESAYSNWMTNRTKQSSTYNIQNDSAEIKNILYFDHQHSIAEIAEIAKSYENFYNTICIVPEDFNISNKPFNLIILKNNKQLKSYFEEIIAKTCIKLNIHYFKK